MGVNREFSDPILKDFSGGLNNRVEKSSIKDNEASEIQNIDFAGAGAIQPRRGSSRFGQDNGGSSAILATWRIPKVNGLDVPMRAWSSVVEYYHSGTSQYEILQTGMTVGLQYGRASYNNSGFWGNGTNDFTGWNGAYNLLNGALTASGYASVTLDDTTLFSAGGSAIVGTTVFTYTAKDATHLLGCTGAPVASDNAAIAQAPVTYPSNPKGHLYAWHKFRLYVVSENTTTLNYTGVDDPTNFGAGGSSGFKTGGDDIKAIIPLETGLIVFKENSIWNFYFDSSGTPVKDLVVELDQVGAIGAYAACQVENDIFYVAKDGNVRRLGRSANYSVGVGLRLDLSSNKIQGTIDQIDSSSASLFYFDKKLYISTKLSGDTFNNYVLVYDYDYDAWSIYRGWNVADWFVFEGSLYFGSSSENNCFRVLTGWQDDDASVSTKWLSKQFDFGSPHEAKTLRWIYVEGYVSSSTNIKATVYYDNGTSIKTQEKTISGTGSYVDSSDTQVFGSTVYSRGSWVLGGSSDVVLKKFRVRIQPLNTSFFNVQIKFSTDGEDQVYQITKVVPYVRKESAERVPQAQLI